ncbi:MAG: 1,4-alpha-glucan branching protein GlgB [Butyricicoccaceae bacterium]
MLNEQVIHSYLTGCSAHAYQTLGAHVGENGGAYFAVHAPNAKRVTVCGEFNNWNDWDMTRREDGIWFLHSWDIKEGQLYKYRITAQDGRVMDRADPFAFWSEKRPGTASRVYNINGYQWRDAEWMRTRNKNFNRPMQIYEVHAGSWRRHPPKGKYLENGEEDFGEFYTYTELADELIPYVKAHHYTHIELLPLNEHPFDGSWGYQTSGYFAATSRYGSPKELMAMIDRFHQAGIGVIMDCVPVHFVSDMFALQQFDGGFVYESEFQDLRFSEWGTVLFDYSKPNVISFMRSSINFWIEYYHIDGLRYDAVSHMIYRHGDPSYGFDGRNDPNIFFLQSTNYFLQHEHPQVMLIAEDSSDYIKVTAPAEYGGLGFDYKWDLGWMNDTLEYMAKHPADRAFNPQLLTFSMAYFYQNNYLLPLSHDEVVHGKKTIVDKIWGNYEQKFSQARLLYLYMLVHPGRTLSFMGNELGEFREWDERKALGWNLLTYPIHDAFNRFMMALGELGVSQRPLYEQDYNSRYFEWADMGKSSPTVFTIARRDTSGNQLLAILNFGLTDLRSYKIPGSSTGVWEELINTDDNVYGGQGRVNNGSVFGTARIAPLSGCLLRKIGGN